MVDFTHAHVFITQFKLFKNLLTFHYGKENYYHDMIKR